VKISRGFTLVELMVVFILSGILTAGMVSLFGEAIKGINAGESRVVAVQLAQERMEQLVAERRADKYNSFSTSGDSVTFGTSNYLRSVSSVAYSGAACPSGMSCKEVQVIVSLDGLTKADLTMLLVDY